MPRLEARVVASLVIPIGARRLDAYNRKFVRSASLWHPNQHGNNYLNNSSFFLVILDVFTRTVLISSDISIENDVFPAC